MPDTVLNHLTREMLADIDVLMLGRDHLGTDAWRREFEKLIIEHHAAAYFSGQGANGLTPTGDRVLGQALEKQIDYLAGFAEQVEDLSEAQARARAALYAGSLRATYTKGQTEGWDIPVAPGDGSSECLGNCQCTLRLDVLSEEQGDANVHWDTHAKEDCPTCTRRGAGSPYRIRGGQWLDELQ